MARLVSSANEAPSLLDLRQKALELRINRLESEKEYLGLRGKEIVPEQAAEIENKHIALLHQLELEGAEIEQQYVVLLRRSLGNVGIEIGGGLWWDDRCFFCKDCVTAHCLTCTACQSCVTWV